MLKRLTFRLLALPLILSVVIVGVQSVSHFDGVFFEGTTGVGGLASFCRETPILAKKCDWAIEISGI